MAAAVEVRWRSVLAEEEEEKPSKFDGQNSTLK